MRERTDNNVFLRRFCFLEPNLDPSEVAILVCDWGSFDSIFVVVGKKIKKSVKQESLENKTLQDIYILFSSGLMINDSCFTDLFIFLQQQKSNRNCPTHKPKWPPLRRCGSKFGSRKQNLRRKTLLSVRSRIEN